MNDKYIFDGNCYESVPRALFFDNRLTPIERNAWQVLKIFLEADGMTSLTTYEQLQPYLTTSPLTGNASTETVARALTMLRLTGWLSLISKRRHDKGTVQGNVYVLHDEPLSIYERLQMDADYLNLLSNATIHSSKTIQKVAQYTLNELINDPHVADKKLPSRLEMLTERLKQLDITAKKLSTTTDTEGSKSDLLRNDGVLNTESKVNLKRSDSNRLRHRKHISSSKDKKILLQEIQNHLKLPSGFLQLSLQQQENSLLALSVVDATQQQQVLDEWQQCCEQRTIRNPVAYLHGIIQKALQGELNLLRSPPQSVSTQSSVIKSSSPSGSATEPDLSNTTAPKLASHHTLSTASVESNAKPTDSITARGYLNDIKQMLKAGPMDRR